MDCYLPREPLLLPPLREPPPEKLPPPPEKLLDELRVPPLNDDEL